MSRAQPKSSPMDRHARRIAAAIAKGRPPALTPDLDLYLESSPREIFVAFEGVARHMPPGGNDETLALGYLFLLQQLLERLRYRTDRGYADAARLIADFQADVAARLHRPAAALIEAFKGGGHARSGQLLGTGPNSPFCSTWPRQGRSSAGYIRHQLVLLSRARRRPRYRDSVRCSRFSCGRAGAGRPEDFPCAGRSGSQTVAVVRPKPDRIGSVANDPLRAFARTKSRSAATSCGLISPMC